MTAARAARSSTRAQLLALLLIPFGGAAGAVSAQGCDSQPSAVAAVFDSYRAALASGDGATATELVDAETLRYFEDLKRLARFGDEQQIRGRSFVDRLLVLSMRHALAPSVLDDLTFERLIHTAMTEGWIRPETVGSLSIGAVTVDGDEAWADAAGGIAAPTPATEPAPETVKFRFVCERGGWRFRFSTLVEQLNRLVTELTRQLGANEDDLLFALIEQFSGEKVLPEIWQQPEAPPGP